MYVIRGAKDDGIIIKEAKGHFVGRISSVIDITEK